MKVLINRIAIHYTDLSDCMRKNRHSNFCVNKRFLKYLKFVNFEKN